MPVGFAYSLENSAHGKRRGISKRSRPVFLPNVWYVNANQLSLRGSVVHVLIEFKVRNAD